MPIPNCGQCRFVIFNPYSGPLCGRIVMKPGMYYVPCNVARSYYGLCGIGARFFESREELKSKKPEDLK